LIFNSVISFSYNKVVELIVPGKEKSTGRKTVIFRFSWNEKEVQSTSRYANTLNYFVKYNIFGFLRLPLMPSFSVPIFGETLKSPPSTKGAGLRADSPLPSLT